MVAKIVRSYQSGETQYKLPMLTVAQHLGYSLAPIAVISLQSVNLWVGSIHITYANITSLIVLGLVMIQQLLVTLFAHDLSSEYDLKEKEFNEEDVHKNPSATSVAVMKDIFTHWQTMLMIVLTFVSVAPSLVPALPVFIMEILQYSESVVNMSFAVLGVTSIIIALVLVTQKISPIGSYYLGTLSFLALMFISPIMLTLLMNVPNHCVDITLLAFIVILMSLFRLGETMFTHITLAKLTRSSNQTYVESIRQIARTIGDFMGVLLTVHYMSNLLTFCLITSIVSSLLVFILV